MPGRIDRPPDLVAELRGIKARLLELERSSNRLAAVTVLDDGTATLLDSTGENVEFGTVVIDTAGAFDPGDPDTLTVPYTGVYLICGSGDIEPSGAATGLRLLEITASTPTTTQVGFTLPALPSNGWSTAPVTMAFLEAGDTVRLIAFQTSGTTLDVSNGRLAMAWLGNKPADV